MYKQPVKQEDGSWVVQLGTVIGEDVLIGDNKIRYPLEAFKKALEKKLKDKPYVFGELNIPVINGLMEKEDILGRLSKIDMSKRSHIVSNIKLEEVSDTACIVTGVIRPAIQMLSMVDEYLSNVDVNALSMPYIAMRAVTKLSHDNGTEVREVSDIITWDLCYSPVK